MSIRFCSSAPNFTEDVVLRLFAEVLGMPFFDEIDAENVPEAFIEHVPAPYAQHHYVIGYKPADDDGIMTLLPPIRWMRWWSIMSPRCCDKPVEMALSTRAAITVGDRCRL